MPTRRELVSVLGAGAATVAIRPTLALGEARESISASPWWLIAPLTPGSPLLDGWKVDHLGPITEGASVLSLTGNGSLRVHICLHQGRPKGFAYTELFDLIVMDHGRGVKDVPADLSPTLNLLERTIRDNESMEVGEAEFQGLTRLMTHSERVSAFGASKLN
jgi:hypothetical protein